MNTEDKDTAEMDYRKSHLQAGDDYDASFRDRPHRALMWDMEREVLDAILAKWFDGTQIHLLDFACGTGRVLSHLESKVSSATGVDISPSMLEVAREKCKIATIHEGDITREDILDNKPFSLITAFRFFPNAEPALRQEVIAKLHSLLADDGFLVFNNHRNDGSLLRKTAKLIGVPDDHTMSQVEVAQMLSENGLTIVDEYPLGVLPLTDKKMLRPVAATKMIETGLSKMPSATSLAQSVIYVCKKK